MKQFGINFKNRSFVLALLFFSVILIPVLGHADIAEDIAAGMTPEAAMAKAISEGMSPGDAVVEAISAGMSPAAAVEVALQIVRPEGVSEGGTGEGVTVSVTGCDSACVAEWDAAITEITNSGLAAASSAEERAAIIAVTAPEQAMAVNVVEQVAASTPQVPETPAEPEAYEPPEEPETFVPVTDTGFEETPLATEPPVQDQEPASQV